MSASDPVGPVYPHQPSWSTVVPVMLDRAERDKIVTALIKRYEAEAELAELQVQAAKRAALKDRRGR